ncbi:MAG: hypothetical protein DME04_20665 [Candidatus Rokuibacteriota bacterium]|nr:MAG: hypothetical protein DME04_20665 [Candidatus Rokubacteria bacterium]
MERERAAEDRQRHRLGVALLLQQTQEPAELRARGRSRQKARAASTISGVTWRLIVAMRR